MKSQLPWNRQIKPRALWKVLPDTEEYFSINEQIFFDQSPGRLILPTNTAKKNPRRLILPTTCKEILETVKERIWFI